MLPAWCRMQRPRVRPLRARGRSDVRCGAVRFNVVALVGLAGAACEAVPLVAPSASTLSVAVAERVVPAGGSTMVTAHVVEVAGTAVHDGTVVTFTSTLGVMHPEEAATVRGRARAVFTAGSASGIAEVRAYSGGAMSEAVEVTVGAAAVSAVRVTAQPSSLPPSGGSTTVVATAVDGGQNPLPGVAVTFSASAGTLRPVLATTDGGGNARTVLTTTATAEVTATAGDHEPAMTTVTVAEAPVITLAASPSAPVAGQAVSFEVAVEPGTETIRQVAMAFGDGKVADLGAVLQATVAHAYGAAGTYTVTVTATDTAGSVTTTAIVVVVAEAPGVPVTIAADAQEAEVGQPVTFTVEVSPPEGAPAVRNVTVDFGDGSDESLGSLTGTGTVAHIYRRSGSYVASATVRDAAGRRRTASTGIRVVDAPDPPEIEVTVTAEPAAGAVGEVITFTVAASGGGAAVTEVVIDFGDGDAAKLEPTRNRQETAHAYEKAGAFVVTVTMTDTRGGRGAASVVVTIQ